MNQQNIENFNNATLFILSHLYSLFPEKVDFDSFDIAIRELITQTGSMLIPKGAEDPTEEGGELEFLNCLTSTTVWLQEEQYIRYQEHNPPHEFKGVVLSNKGLVLLQKPSALNPSVKLVESIKAEFKKGAALGLQSLGQQLIKSGVSRYLVSE
ncbi:hypothetical protein ACSV5M_10225 [Cellvibrio sp. ARAG 10.3]|uniref:hypothetical protein n=1 Tax=Cellvibrio sp. ARAG 10.3 TaxID=3451358 RepID=UPI003F48DDA6